MKKRKNRKRIFYHVECEKGNFYWFRKERCWKVLSVEEPRPPCSSNVRFRTMNKAKKHLHKLPDDGVFTLYRDYINKRGHHFIRSWEYRK